MENNKELEECEICYAMCKAESLGKHRIWHMRQARMLQTLGQARLNQVSTPTEVQPAKRGTYA